MGLRDIVASQTREIEHLQDKIQKLQEENDDLKNQLADRAFPAETVIEDMEASILKATKTCVDALRGLNKKETP